MQKHLAGQVLTGGPWSLAIYGKGWQYRILWSMDHLLLRGSGVQVPVCPGPLVLCGCGRGYTRWFQVQLKSNVLSSAHASGAWLEVLGYCL